MTTPRRRLHPALPTAFSALALSTLVGGLALSAEPANAQRTSGRRQVSYTKDILPILRSRCTICHGVDEKGGFKLDTYENLMAGGKSGAVITPGSPPKSHLVARIEGTEKPRMPLDAPPLSGTERFTIREWVLQGAKDDSNADEPVAAVKPLTVLTPQDGAVVRENVRIVVPRDSVPDDGFVAIYIDNKFRVALAPGASTNPRLAKAPVTYIWDTKQPLTLDTTVVDAERIVSDGPHVVEVRSYRSDGTEAERVKKQVILQNTINVAANLPVSLSYGATTRGIGRQYQLEHVVSVDANPGQIAPVRVGQPANAGKLTHVETTQNMVSLEDVTPATGAGFWRERRESPIVVVVNGLKQIVRLETSSRYYSLSRTGQALVSRQMEREQRDPLINPLDLPGRSVRLNETFNTNLRINLGAYIPGSLNIPNAEAKLERMEWQFGEQCVVIRAEYLGGRGIVNIRTWNFENVPFDIQRGSSTFWFSPKSNRVLKAEHDLEGSIEVPNDGTGAAAGGGLGGEFGPGAGMMGAGMMPGGMSGGSRMPGGMMQGMGMPPGMAGGTAGMMPGGMGGADRRSGMMGAGRMPGGMSGPGGMTGPGMMTGGMMPGGMMPGGMMPGGMMPGGMMPGGMGGAAPPPVIERTRRFHVLLKVGTKLSTKKTASR
jgi:hypothetical protein